jgi:transposase-like protein
VCPRCGSPNIRKPSWTGWGGFIGPLIINHWICNQCSFGFNPKTGKSTTGAIVIYVVVSLMLGLIIAIAAAAGSR